MDTINYHCEEDFSTIEQRIKGFDVKSLNRIGLFLIRMIIFKIYQTLNLNIFRII